MREMPPQDSVLLPRDHDPILYLKATAWYCGRRDEHAGSAVWLTWINVGPEDDFQRLGRCSSCGQKYILADARDTNVPTVDEQLAWLTPHKRPPV